MTSRSGGRGCLLGGVLVGPGTGKGDGEGEGEGGRGTHRSLPQTPQKWTRMSMS